MGFFDRKPTYKTKVLSSLAKVFSDEEPKYLPECTALSGLWGETVSFQVAYFSDAWMPERLEIRVVSELKEQIRVRTVEPVPVIRATNGIVDDNYLRTTPGLYPDLLRDLKDGVARTYAGQWRSLWVDVTLVKEISAGAYPIEIQFLKDGEMVTSAKTSVTVIGAELLKQKIMRTEWLHADCLADYYKVPVFSEEHWKLVENYIRNAVLRGCTMMIVPLFTSPLDTAVGNDRTTCQLVKVSVVNGEYEIDFSQVKRWIDLCKACGVEYFEMSHLFSQWGAKYPPKVVAMVDGKEEKIFGWHTPAVGEYTRFLNVFLPKLTSLLTEWGIAENTYFHISDEPRPNQVDTYRAAKESLGNMLEGYHTFDAFSSYEFYKQGLVDKPVPGNNEIEEFLAHGLTDMWTYYCTGQFLEVSNRFMSMPSARNRIYGVQLYKYKIIGVLHWGFNFYNNQYSFDHINPYQVTDAGGAFPAGDAFLVYPGEDGMPEESIREMVQYEAMTDLRALQMLESLTDREFVLDLIEGDLTEPMTFKRYPKSDAYLIGLRNKVNKEIAKRI